MKNVLIDDNDKHTGLLQPVWITMETSFIVRANSKSFLQYYCS